MPECLKTLCDYVGTDHEEIRHVRTGEIRHACPVHVDNILDTQYYEPVEVDE